MSGFARLLAAACVAAASTLAASAPTDSTTATPSASAPVATFESTDALAAQRVLLRRRDCSKWWTCGPFKRDKPRLA